MAVFFVSVPVYGPVSALTTYRSRTAYDGTWRIEECHDGLGFYTRVYRHGTTSIWRHACMSDMQRSYDRFLRNRERRFLGIF